MLMMLVRTELTITPPIVRGTSVLRGRAPKEGKLGVVVRIKLNFLLFVIQINLEQYKQGASNVNSRPF